jgi:FixJ family two-component response regulator
MRCTGLALAEHEGVTFVSAVVHIVDDDASFRTSTDRVLRASGYTVETYEAC